MIEVQFVIKKHVFDLGRIASLAFDGFRLTISARLVELLAVNGLPYNDLLESACLPQTPAIRGRIVSSSQRL